MATLTPRLALRKPAGTDLVNVVTDLDNNYDIIDNAARVTTAQTFVARQDITLTADGPSLGINRAAATMAGGSLVITRDAVAKPQSIALTFGPAASVAIGRAANSDHLEIGYDFGGGYVKKFQLDSGGGFLAVGQDHYLGVNSLGAAGSRLRFSAGADANAYIIAEGSAADVHFRQRIKGAGIFSYENEAGTVRATLDASSCFNAGGTNSKFGTGALGAAGTFMRVGDQGDANAVYLIADGSGANVGLVIRSKGTSEIDFADGTGGTNFLRMGKIAGVPKLGFYGAAPFAQPTVTGSKAANAALASLLAGLQSMGLLIDSST